MSEDSKRRLMMLLNSLLRSAALPVMVSLTFPEEVRLTAFEAKACRAAWEKRMRRLYGAAWAAIWRLEAHPEMSARLGRMHPHFHLLTWGAWYDLAEVSRSWTAVVWEVLKIDPCLVDADGRLVREKSVEAGTNCERVQKWEGVMYCAKRYIAKEEEYPLGEAGRVWGVHNRARLPIAEEVRIPLSFREVLTVRMGVEAWMDKQEIVSQSLIRTFFCNDPQAFVASLVCHVAGLPRGRQDLPRGKFARSFAYG